MSYVLDTNIVSFILRENEQVTKRFRQAVAANELFLACPVIWFEVRRGLLAKDARRQMERFNALFAKFEWDDYTREDWTLAGELWSRRQAKGLPIADADLLIAVFAINRDAVLVTDNEKDFVELGLTIENWTVT